jgi:hypothetical protein
MKYSYPMEFTKENIEKVEKENMELNAEISETLKMMNKNLETDIKKILLEMMDERALLGDIGRNLSEEEYEKASKQVNGFIRKNAEDIGELELGEQMISELEDDPWLWNRLSGKTLREKVDTYFLVHSQEKKKLVPFSSVCKTQDEIQGKLNAWRKRVNRNSYDSERDFSYNAILSTSFEDNFEELDILLLIREIVCHKDFSQFPIEGIEKITELGELLKTMKLENAKNSEEEF